MAEYLDTIALRLFRTRLRLLPPPRPGRPILRLGLLVAFLVVGLGRPAGVLAAEIAGVAFEERSQSGTERIALRGAGLLRYRVVFKGYAAAFYLPEEVPADGALADVPRRLEIEYFWSIPAREFVKATDAGIARNVDAATLSSLRPRIDRLNRLYRDVEPGDRYALTYVPGTGTSLSLNGRVMGVIEGADFSAALFGIWLGDTPLDRGLKKKLLGKS